MIRGIILKALEGCCGKEGGADLTAYFGTDLLEKAGPTRARHEQLAHRVREALRSQLDVGLAHIRRGSARYRIWDADLAARLSSVSEDPDKVLIGWLAEGAPVGVAQEVACGGVFPRAPCQAVDGDALSETLDDGEPPENYASVVAEPAKSAKELNRLVGLGYAARYYTFSAAVAELGPGITSKLAAIFSERGMGRRRCASSSTRGARGTTRSCGCTSAWCSPASPTPGRTSSTSRAPPGSRRASS